MRISQLASLIIWSVLLHAPALHAQQPAPQPPVGGGDCDSQEERFRAIGRALNICPDLDQILRPNQAGRLAPELLQPGGVERFMNEQPGGESLILQQFASEMHQRGSRDHVTQALVTFSFDTNRVLAQVQHASTENQLFILKNEARLYSRTKFLNAFLGTTVGAVGTGLQLSHSLTVQRAGDIVGVGGGIITALFALCTADINIPDPLPGYNPGDNGPPPPTPTGRLFQAFADNNQSHQIPAEVWELVDNGTKEAMVRSLNGSTTSKKSFLNKLGLSCHFSGGKLQTLADRIAALSQLEDQLSTMNQNGGELMQTLSAQ